MVPAGAQNSDSYFVRGIVRDSVSDDVLPYASVVVAGTTRGAVTDANGIFELNVPTAAKALQISCMGYEKKVLPIHRGNLNMYAVYMKPSSTELRELVVHKG